MHFNINATRGAAFIAALASVFVSSAKTYSHAGHVITPSEKCIVVDGAPDRDTGRWVYESFNEAAAHLTDGTADAPMQVYVAPWVYWIDDPDDPEVKVGKDGREPFGLVVKCDHLHITGLGADPRETVLASARGQTQGAVGNFTMLDFWGDGLEVRNLTMGNFCNVDLEYPGRPDLSRTKRLPTITQAHVAYCHGDRALAEDVRFIGRLNLNPINGARRMLYNRCHLEMTDDALTGNGVYLSCTFDFYGQRPLWNSHTNGAVFLDCDFTAMHDTPRTFFCKSVGQVTLVDCRFHAGRPLYVGWTNTPPQWLRCYQHNVTLDGQQYVVGADNPSNTVSMSQLPLLEAYRITSGDSIVYNTWNLLRGDDDWDPLGVRHIVEHSHAGTAPMATSLVVSPREATVTAGVDLTNERGGNGGGADTLWVKAAAFLHNGYPAQDTPLQWRVQPGHECDVAIIPDGNRCGIVSVRDADGDARCVVTATSPAGLQCAVALTVRPSILEAPALTSAPRIELSHGKASLCYTADLGDRADMSDITWSRSTRPDGSGAIPVAVTRGDSPLKEYALSQADAGYYLVADIRPRHIRSLHGPSVRCVSSVKVSADMAPASDFLFTDFSDFPTYIQPDIKPGFWTVDCHKPIDTEPYDWTPDPAQESWVYGEGFNGARGLGLLQQQKGARLIYTPLPGDYGDMVVDMLVDPTKTAGQGFGSATGQYMDICLKFDAATLTGYALRIERTVKSGHAVDFSLVSYRDGVVTRLTDPVTAACYLTGCHISISAIGDRLTASVHTDSNVPDVEGAEKSVALEAAISPGSCGGFALQHTGSCGESTTMLHTLRISYPK